MTPATKKIQDYAVIGNARSSALISKYGSIDWLCWPFAHSNPILGGLLDEDQGHWSIAPSEDYQVHRAYIPNTNVLQTTFFTPQGKVVMTDLMPVASAEECQRSLMPEHEILRRVECVEGSMDLDFDLSLCRLSQPVFKCKNRTLGIRAPINDGELILKSTIDIPFHSLAAKKTFSIKEKEVIYFSMTFSQEAPAVLPLLDQDTDIIVERSILWWKDFASMIFYNGPYQDMVIRSALFLKLMSYAPSGAIIAAPTTSLPERLGGDLNWDYRFCWLRDASLTTRALMRLHLVDEARAFVNWLLHATNLTRPKLNVVYDVYGRYPQKEKTVEDWKGFADSRPVRFGNKAALQHQLDIYGEVICGALYVLEKEEEIDKETQHMLKELGDYICKHWKEEDAGMWEIRGRKEHFTHSLLLCWAGLNALLKLHDKELIEKLNVSSIHHACEEMSRTIRMLAWNEQEQSYTSVIRGKDVDASLLLLPWYQLIHPDSTKMKKTYERIKKELVRDGLVYRNRENEEGAFILCSFWLVEYLAQADDTLEEAEELFTSILEHANDVGLLSEEIDPATGDLLGNFPLVFSHMGLINAALTLEEKRNQKRSVKTNLERIAI